MMFSAERRLASGLAASAVALATAAGFISFDRSAPKVETVDFGLVRTVVTPAYDATLPPASDAPIKEFRIPITHESIQIADGVDYQGWTFGGTVPGPTIRAREGDRIRITLVNESPMPHSIDFHSARIAPNEAYRTIQLGEEVTFEFIASDPGVYVVHCGTPPVLLHLMQGMYLTMVVDPRNGWGTQADKEFVITQSEFYTITGEGTTLPDYSAARDKQATYVTFNGKAFQYRANPLLVEVGDRVRFFVANPGPSLHSDFHVVGTVFDRVYVDGNPNNVLESVQTWSVPAGGGAVFETVFGDAGAVSVSKAGAGIYPFVTHSFADAEKGAVGLIRVGHPVMTAGRGH
jgi:nitrite reductase (NO-forming)